MRKIYFLLLRRQNWTCVRNGGIEKMTRNPPRICFLWGISTRNQIVCLAGMFTFPSFFPAPSLQKCQIHWKLKEERDLKVWNCRFYLFTKFIEVMIGLFYKIQSNQTLYLTLIRWSEQIQNFLSQPSVNFMLFESLISILDIFSRTLGLWSWSWSNTDPRNYRDFKIAIHDE